MARPRRETHLMARWSKREKDIEFSWPKHKADGHYLYGVFQYGEKGALAELERRGYDLTTLRFSIALKPAAPTLPESR